MKNRMLASALAALFALPIAAHAASTRTHVSNSGSDANAAFSCDAAHPCRTFATALSVTTPGGEILAVDSSGYGKVEIDRSVSIIAAPGVFAGIGVGAGGNAIGVKIATPGVDVVLRGLAITGQGGIYGINMDNGATLSVEDCVISGFSGNSYAGIRIDAAAKVRVVDSLLRANTIGLFVMNGTVSVAGSRFLGNASAGITGFPVAGATVSIAVSDTVVADSNAGISSWSQTTGNVTVAVTRTTVSNSSHGLYAAATAAGTAKLSVSDSLINKNDYGLNGQGSATVKSLGNNTVVDNLNATFGSVVTVPFI